MLFRHISLMKSSIGLLYQQKVTVLVHRRSDLLIYRNDNIKPNMLLYPDSEPIHNVQNVIN